MHSRTAEHLERIRTQVLDGFSLRKVGAWIQKRTFLEGKPFTFKDHEYQERLVQEECNDLVVKKPSQVGFTELAVRWTLGVMDILGDIHVIYTLPTAGFAKTVAQTRFDPVIAGSEYLSERVNSNIDSTQTKQIGSSFLYIKGTIGMNAAISVPASLLVHDEVDFSDQDVLSSYQSRLTHSRYKLRFRFSTPTLAGYGIDEAMKNSRRWFNFCRCNHCEEWFLPDYFRDVKIPGWNDDLKNITKENLHSVRYKEARLLCPHCGREPNLGPSFRGWVLENPNEAHPTTGFQVSPFDAPAIVTCAHLVESQTKYKRFTDFVNFGLGQCAEDGENRLTLEELKSLWVGGDRPAFSSHIAGIDVGLTSHLLVAGQIGDGRIMIVGMDQIRLSEFWKRFADHRLSTPISNGVIDSQPYVDLVAQVQSSHSGMYAAVYSESKSTEIFRIKDKDEDPDKLQNYLQMIDVNRNKALDQLMSDMRGKKVLFHEPSCAPFKETWLRHMQDMKRIQKPDKHGEFRYVWEKTKGDDHFHHGTLYVWLAAQMRGFTAPSIEYGLGIKSFRNKAKS